MCHFELSHFHKFICFLSLFQCRCFKAKSNKNKKSFSWMKSADIVILKTLQKRSIFVHKSQWHVHGWNQNQTTSLRYHYPPHPRTRHRSPLLLRRQIRLRLCLEGELGHLSESTDKFVPSLIVVVIGVSKEGNRLNLR